MLNSEFFDLKAPSWDDNFSPTLPARTIVAALCGAKAGDRILDIACGTGAMFGELLALEPCEIVGSDISPLMCRKAREKYAAEPRISVVCGDVLDLPPSLFDCATLYNGYPHFPDREALLKKVHSLLKPGGRFLVAHNNGREGINKRHENMPEGVARELLPAAEDARLWSALFEVDILCDTDSYYIISGKAI